MSIHDAIVLYIKEKLMKKNPDEFSMNKID